MAWTRNYQWKRRELLKERAHGEKQGDKSYGGEKEEGKSEATSGLPVASRKRETHPLGFARDRSYTRAYKHFVSARVFILYARKNHEACKSGGEDQLTRDYRKPESIRLYLTPGFPFYFWPLQLTSYLTLFSHLSSNRISLSSLGLICGYARFTLFLLLSQNREIVSGKQPAIESTRERF